MKSKIPNERLAKWGRTSKTEMVAGHAALTALQPRNSEDYGIPGKGLSAATSRRTKYSKTEVSYRLAAAGAKRRCRNCRMFQVANRDCTAVEGRIEGNYVCNIWKLKVPPSSVNSIKQHD